MNLLITFLHLIFFALARNTTSYGIPKILWTFWDSGLDSASIFTRMCVNNMKYYTNISGWEFKFLSNENYTEYISKEGVERIDRMYSHSQHKIGKQNWADIMRLTLIYENGGMWLDTNSFFVGNLSWIQNIFNQKWPYNRVSDAPQIITFSLNTVMGGNYTSLYDEQLKQDIYLFPGLEIWSFISKPKSKFLQDVLNRLEYSLKTSRQILDKQTESERIVFGREKDPYYITSNYLFQTVMQKKQHELQSTIASVNGTKYAVGYYKMWSIPAQETIYGIFSAYNWFTFSILNAIFKEDIQTFATKYNIPAYFIKFNGGNYPHANNALVLHELAKCLGVDVNIKQGSVFDEFMLGRSESMQQVKNIKRMYELGYMDDNQCKHNDEKVFAYIGQFKKNIYYLLGALVLFHALLFYFVKKANQKED